MGWGGKNVLATRERLKVQFSSRKKEGSGVAPIKGGKVPSAQEKLGTQAVDCRRRGSFILRGAY